MNALADQLACMHALRFEREPPAVIDAIAIVGSTCAGKTTLAGAIRRAALPGVEVPPRFVTRPPRAGDLAEEATRLSSAELDAAIAAGTLAIHWTRTLEHGRRERYAFAPVATGVLPVYSANNAILVAGTVQPPGALANALIVGVYAPDPVREQRFRSRSPDLWRDRPDEASARLAERGDAMRPHAHVIVENHGALEVTAQADVVALVRAVRERWSTERVVRSRSSG